MPPVQRFECSDFPLPACGYQVSLGLFVEIDGREHQGDVHRSMDVDPINSVGNICDSRFTHERQGFEAYGNIALASLVISEKPTPGTLSTDS